MHCLIIGAKKVDERFYCTCCQVTVKLWRQCFHGRSDDERDTWCHDVGAKCHCHLQAHQIWQMAICSVQVVVCIRILFSLKQTILHMLLFCLCVLCVCMCVYRITSFITYLCVCCTVEVWQRGSIDSSADRGQPLASGDTSPFLTPQQQQVIHVRQTCWLSRLQHMAHIHFCIVIRMYWWTLICVWDKGLRLNRLSVLFMYVIIWRGQETLALGWLLWLWTVNSISRWQETACLVLFSFPWCTKPLVFSK